MENAPKSTFVVLYMLNPSKFWKNKYYEFWERNADNLVVNDALL